MFIRIFCGVGAVSLVISALIWLDTAMLNLDTSSIWREQGQSDLADWYHQSAINNFIFAAIFLIFALVLAVISIGYREHQTDDSDASAE